MSIDIKTLIHCFQGVTPSCVATCASDGTPNVTYVSQVFYVDPHRVALSCQFFNKTRQNLDANPFVSVQLYDPTTFEAYELALRFDHSETSGPLFDSMALRIRAIASHTGMSGVFRLLSADVFEVLSVEPVEGFLEPASASRESVEIDTRGTRNELRSLQVIGERICRAPDLERLLDRTLESLEELFGLRHSLVLVPEDENRLVTIASRGYGDAGIGAEVAMGEGLIGTVAREKRLLRVVGVDEGLRYGRAIRGRVAERVGPGALRPEIPLPGLPDARSQLALPLVVQDRLVGVLAVESRDALQLDEWLEAMLQVIANQVAIGVDRRLDEDEEDEDDGSTPAATTAPTTRRFVFYQNDECVFVDDEYLVRNVPGKILWKLLTTHRREGRREFSNRELRLDPWLGLPAIKDNLESRLILLRKRLAEKCPDVRIIPVRRGRFALEIDGPIELVERASS